MVCLSFNLRVIFLFIVLNFALFVIFGEWVSLVRGSVWLRRGYMVVKKMERYLGAN